MKLQGTVTMNGKTYVKGSDVPWYTVYPFFLVHMLIFGGSGFLMAYGKHHPPVVFLYLHGGFAILVYTLFYISFFGRDQVEWMFINAALGVFGVYSQISWILSFFGKRMSDYPYYVHAVPFLYFVLYTFLLRHAVMDITNSRNDPKRARLVGYCYVAASLIFYAVTYYIERRRQAEWT